MGVLHFEMGFTSFLRWIWYGKEGQSDPLLVQQQWLEYLIQAEWQFSQRQSTLDLNCSSLKLEQAGFLPEFNSRFDNFASLLRALYDNAIKGEDVASILNGTKQRRDTRSENLSIDYFAHTLGVGSSEAYKLENPRYLLARTAKELVKTSPIGAAIAEYRKLHPFLPLPSFPEGAADISQVDFTAGEGEVLRFMPPGSSAEDKELSETKPRPTMSIYDLDTMMDCTRQGTQMSYIPTIFYRLQEMQSPLDREQGKPYLSGSDAGEGDFYYAAFDLIADESHLMQVIEHNGYEDNGAYKAVTTSSINDRIDLIKLGLNSVERYAQKFLRAKQKMEKYDVEALGAYFVRGAVGKDGEEGQLRLFGANPPTGTRYCS